VCVTPRRLAAPVFAREYVLMTSIFQRLNILSPQRAMSAAYLTAVDDLKQAPLTPTSPCVVAGKTCVVCLDDLQTGQSATTLPCNHVYHAACLRPWLRRANACPTCRSEAIKLVADDAGVGVGASELRLPAVN
jgi:hypothetical protein